MKIRFPVIFLLLFCLFLLPKIEAQPTLENGKIPDDLLIVLKRQEGWGGTYSEITITANGDWTSQTRGGLPSVSRIDILSLSKYGKIPKYLKPKLSDEKLKLLISEFEKIQFFNFGKDFPKEEADSVSITDAASEVISIRINGQTKEVSNYLGDFTKRSSILRNLAERIRGAGIWNYENGEIPENFEVWYRITVGDKTQKDIKINAKGKVTETLYSRRFYSEADKELPVFIKSKTVGKLSKQQLKQLINEFEKAVFSTFKYSILTKYNGCSNEPLSTSEKRTHINVQINHIAQMYASLYENCNAKPETDAAKFEYMANEIEKLLKNIKTKK